MVKEFKTEKGETIKENIATFCPSKYTIKRVENATNNLEETCNVYNWQSVSTHNVFKFYRENLMEIQAKALMLWKKKHKSPLNIWKCSKSLVIREIQSKTIIFHIMCTVQAKHKGWWRCRTTGTRIHYQRKLVQPFWKTIWYFYGVLLLHTSHPKFSDLK